MDEPPLNERALGALFCPPRKLAVKCASNKGKEVAIDRDGLVYLATPYTHEDPRIRETRFREVNFAAAFFMCKLGLHIFSPISHSVPIAEDGNTPTTWEFWKEYDFALLQVCKRMIVLTQDGWRSSAGVAGEMEIATNLGLDIAYISPRTVRELDKVLPSIA